VNGAPAKKKKRKGVAKDLTVSGFIPSGSKVVSKGDWAWRLLGGGTNFLVIEAHP